jgi:hypothetical protein
LTLLVWVPCTGCDPYSGVPPVSSSSEEATVKGTVRIQGKAVTNGIVTFRTANVRRPSSPNREAQISKDGTYTVKTLVGDNYVQVSCKELAMPKNRQFIDVEQTITVNSGEQTIDIDIPPKPQPKS